MIEVPSVSTPQSALVPCRLHRDARGQSSVGYALILCAVGIGAAVLFSQLGLSFGNAIEDTAHSEADALGGGGSSFDGSDSSFDGSGNASGADGNASGAGGQSDLGPLSTNNAAIEGDPNPGGTNLGRMSFGSTNLGGQETHGNHEARNAQGLGSALRDTDPRAAGDVFGSSLLSSANTLGTSGADFERMGGQGSGEGGWSWSMSWGDVYAIAFWSAALIVTVAPFFAAAGIGGLAILGSPALGLAFAVIATVGCTIKLGTTLYTAFSGKKPTGFWAKLDKIGLVAAYVGGWPALLKTLRVGKAFDAIRRSGSVFKNGLGPRSVLQFAKALGTEIRGGASAIKHGAAKLRPGRLAQRVAQTRGARAIQAIAGHPVRTMRAVISQVQAAGGIKGALAVAPVSSLLGSVVGYRAASSTVSAIDGASDVANASTAVAAGPGRQFVEGVNKVWDASNPYRTSKTLDTYAEKGLNIDADGAIVDAVDTVSKNAEHAIDDLQIELDQGFQGNIDANVVRNASTRMERGRQRQTLRD